MSKFYQYFLNTLRFPYLLSGSVITTIVKGIALILDGMRDVIYWLRSQFLPSECVPESLRKYAESRSIKKYSFETEKQYRDRIFGAYVFYAMAGKPDGIKAIFNMYGLDASVESRRNEDPEKWAEFYLIFGDVFGDILESTSEYIEIVNDIKPARSKLAGIKYNIDINANVYNRSCIQTSSINIVQPAELEDIDISISENSGMYIHSVNRTIIGG